MSSQIFGWQGFSIPCPEDFFPSTLTGDRGDGYVQLSSSGSAECQVRWVNCRKTPNAARRLSGYLESLRSSAKIRRLDFALETNECGDFLTYRWASDRLGRGFAKYSSECRRFFIVEWSGDRKASLGPSLKSGMDGFSSCSPEKPELWSISGLSIRLPRSAKLKSHKLMTGKTQLHWTADRTVLSAGRSAFGRELLGKMRLAEWASTIAPKGEVIEEESGVRIVSAQRKGLVTVKAVTLARFDEPRNQLLFANSMYRSDEWEPQWDWFV